MSSVNNPDDCEIIIPEEVICHPGFYYYPDDKRLAVNRLGTVLNLKTNNEVKGSIHNGRTHIHLSSPGKKNCVYKLHRILARTFIGRPSRHLNKKYSKLEVNHIDGDKTNNLIENLEWVTGKENVIHAHENSLHPRDVKVLSLNVYTSELLCWNSIKFCADFFRIHRASLWKHLQSGNSGKYHKDGVVFKYDNGVPWDILPIKQLRRLGLCERINDFIITDKITNSKVILTLEQSCEYLKIKPKYFYKISNKKDFFKYKDYLIERFFSSTQLPQMSGTT